ncbi:MAG: coniferyl aldehyde dehydrogenase [Alphaproteobacteria bacterium]|nr:coniferyl aldehyde dehydrogenase [Alphaproteobacteria bacterium]
MSVAESQSGVNEPAGLAEALTLQRRAQLREGPPDAATRIGRLTRAIAILVSHADAFAEALAADFGHRSRDQTMLTDIAGAIASLKYARAHLKAWMRPDRRAVEFPLGLLGARAEVRHEPKGVVGIISPWNFPVRLAFSPLAGALAAGNRVMIKPSELTPATSGLMARLVGEAFDRSEVAVCPGGPDVAAAFSRLPFDHLLFTGSTTVGRKVMSAAAENLVPVTLELGGKSPAILGRGADLARAASSIGLGKMLNAGQICLAPDYVLAPREAVRPFVAALGDAVAAMFPTLKDNPDYTSVIDARHHERLKGYVAEARARGREIVEINPGKEDFSQQPARKMPLTLILEPDDDLAVMREEIFGPVLPVKAYSTIEEAIAFVAARDRPLALYYFGPDAAEREQVLGHTASGGACVNETLLHESMDDLPFGGIGASGMGAYHGPEGFRTFSHARAVFHQARIDATALLRPPFGERYRKLVGLRIKK